ncbi:MAG TPA: hypothetical protein VHW23_06220 [Kofleriaceae bacterium]|jgi:hypothetical protein|nr:hypothetical protein [Kofleriaceae bacterium]
MWAAANKSMAAATTAAVPPPADRVITKRSRGEGHGSAPAACFEQRRNTMDTQTKHQELETIDSSELASATGGKAKDVIAKVGQGIEKALPSVENAAETIAGLIDG